MLGLFVWIGIPRKVSPWVASSDCSPRSHSQKSNGMIEVDSNVRARVRTCRYMYKYVLAWPPRPGGYSLFSAMPGPTAQLDRLEVCTMHPHERLLVDHHALRTAVLPLGKTHCILQPKNLLSKKKQLVYQYFGNLKQAPLSLGLPLR